MEELLFQLLELAILLIGKFWFVILGFFGYKLLGRLGRRAGKGLSQGQPRTVVLTPVEGGGFPLRKEHPESVEDIQRLESAVVQGKAEGSFFEGEQLPNPVPPDAPIETATTQTDEPVFDPREGMKWAIIYGPPRAKEPHAPPFLARRKNG
jgi:hypothetical protein